MRRTSGSESMKSCSFAKGSGSEMSVPCICSQSKLRSALSLGGGLDAFGHRLQAELGRPAS